MEAVCPLCNGLTSVSFHCPRCGAVLEDGGVIENFYGPYSPYVESDYEVINEKMYCTHLLYCANCNFDVRQSCKMVNI